MIRFACAAAALFVTAAASVSIAHAQHSIDGLLTVESFDGYLGTGLEPLPAVGRLDSDEWRVTGMSEGSCNFGATCNALNSDFTRGSDADTVSEGGLYSFIVTPGNQTFGFQPTDVDVSPGTITWLLTNDTGSTINNVSFEYTLWVRNDQDRATSIAFDYSKDDATYTAVAALGATTGEAPDVTPAWVSARLEADVTGLGLANGGTLYLRWTTADATGTQNRDQLAIDDVTVRMPGCTNGEVEGGEDCDDGNEDDGDGCANDCTEETGFECAGTKPTVCTNIDECDAATDNCDENAGCTDTPGSFTCACNDGYVGDGLTCDDIDECMDELDDCSDDADCANTGGSFTCACHDGFLGDGVECEDIDECGENVDDCDVNAECANTAGSFTCTCDNGYAGDGTDCADVDECEEDLADCDANATCENTPGGFTCTCDDGFDGDGLECQDLDEDGDGVLRDDDNCPRDANPEQEDADGDSFGDACDNNTEGGDEGGGGCGCRAGASSGQATGGLLLLALALFSATRRRGQRRRSARRRAPR
jgi:plastocyanin